METNTEEQKKHIEEGDLVSVPFANQYMQGIVKALDDTHITIENYAQGNVRIPNNELVYKFFPGQKFDLREFNIKDNNSEQGLTAKQKLDSFLSKTQYGSFDSLLKQHPKQVGQLLSGKLTSELFYGSSLVQKQDEEAKTLVNWAAKFQLYRGKDKQLKLDIKFQQKELDLKVYGKEIDPEQKKELMDQGKTITLERTTKENKAFKVFAKYDKDLNRIITSPYSEKIAERIKKYQNEKTTKGQGKAKETKATPKKEATQRIKSGKKYKQ